ncbi:MAG TPA: hypothetical protein VMZ27_17925 [Candidatus Saccharimonadales bacterium]|nr:hypothetical protein [Candidatus Saccharimonadales bacterium]
MNNLQPNLSESEILSRLQSLEPTPRQRVLQSIAAAALGSIPWVGTFITASLEARDSSAQTEINSLHRQWLCEHSRRMEKLSRDLSALLARLDAFGDEILSRVQSESYLALIRKAFRLWDQADSNQKRESIGRLLVNAATNTLCPHDLIRLFLDWIELYHDSHFKVIRGVFHSPGSTRHSIWQRIHGEFPPDNSLEADLFRMLIADLSQGRIIRQCREVNERGQFLKKGRRQRKIDGNEVLMSAFDAQETGRTGRGPSGTGSDQDKSLEAEGLTDIKPLFLGLTGDFQPSFFGARKFPFAAGVLKNEPIAWRHHYSDPSDPRFYKS